MARTQIGDVTIYKPGRGLRIMLTISFALLLLFMANAIAGAIWLVMHNVWTAAAIFFIMFVIGAVLLLLNAVFLFAASHVEVRLDAENAVMTLPNWRGPTPMFPYVQAKIPYKDIGGIETRSEVYRYFGLPVMVHHSSLVRKDGKRFTLGYMRESSEDHSVPYKEIADELARRAGVGVLHRGVVEGGVRARALLRDEPAWDAALLDESGAAALRGREAAIMRAAAIGFIIFVSGGLIFQIVTLAMSMAGARAG